ncbi:hypothetical protein Zm00014a_018395 [Zea mays]|uniref:Uncharacterized protein n=1 Tax=Zea mays TaxID=4577 RepID=A0A3L6G8T0_MAIZE|nr:hypothetical protein Zm00014a_018395 [Zea mays]
MWSVLVRSTLFYAELHFTLMFLDHARTDLKRPSHIPKKKSSGYSLRSVTAT